MFMYSCNGKCCATCALWGGDRDTNVLRGVVEVEATSDKGTCLGGEFKRAEMIGWK
ncbi:MAG: hypothetical protein ACD_59C00052G0002 [uncultured bacterium]|nr:MAG: hypothetical protein ACD_59C00052G0002 [uncultured bacterium]